MILHRFYSISIFVYTVFIFTYGWITGIVGIVTEAEGYQGSFEDVPFLRAEIHRKKKTAATGSDGASPTDFLYGGDNFSL